MDLNRLPQHITQSPEWGEFKTKMGTRAVRVSGVQFTLHKIPFTSIFIGYAPKINPNKIDWEELRDVGLKENCAAIRLDCPNVAKESMEAERAERLLKKFCVPASRTTFAKYTIFLDLTPNTAELLSQMKPKTRYNIRYAERKGICVQEESNAAGLQKFLRLQRETAERQKFLIHPDRYYEMVWNLLAPKGKAHILIAYYQNDPTPLTAYMFFNHQGVFYYPYGGSSSKRRNRQHSSLAMWEGIKLGKRLGCSLFDMWGATDDKNDPWWGFTRFKLGFGGRLVEFIDSYDLVLKPRVYHGFNLAYNLFWKLVALERKVRSG